MEVLLNYTLNNPLLNSSIHKNFLDSYYFKSCEQIGLAIKSGDVSHDEITKISKLEASITDSQTLIDQAGNPYTEYKGTVTQV